MKTVNGGLIIVLAGAILWIGVTGRFPALVAAFGLVKGTAPNTLGIGAATPSGAVPSTSSLTSKTVNPTISQSLNAPVVTLWQNALNSIQNPQHGASASW